MISDNFSVLNWNIIILYECTCNDIDYIIKTLKEIKCPNKYIKEALNNLETCNLNIGLTYSNISLKSSVIVVNKTSSFSLLINTVSHEYFHLICHISKALDIEDEEKLAYLNGYLKCILIILLKILREKLVLNKNLLFFVLYKIGNKFIQNKLNF